MVVRDTARRRLLFLFVACSLFGNLRAPWRSRSFTGVTSYSAFKRGMQRRSCRAAAESRPILVPGDEGSEWWDARNSASPVVLPPDGSEQQWRMWYYGRAATSWARGVDAFLPTGRIGTAASDDGIHWRRLRGSLPEGACLDPSEDEASFDCIHVGVGDVVRLPNGTLRMYYFGGGFDKAMEGRPGLQMQIGLASSEDGGLSWTRLCNGDPVLRHGEAGAFDALFVSWPRVLPPWETAAVDGIADGKWYMSYHTAKFEGGLRWSAGAAFSDDGITWKKVDGPVLEGGADDAWDSAGVGVRSVTVNPDGELAMFYEAVDSAGDHAIGLAESADGVTWRKKDVAATNAPGGPLLTKGDEEDWDGRVVGTPYIVKPTSEDGNWRLYYIGEKKDKPGLSIGVAESDGADISQFQKLR